MFRPELGPKLLRASVKGVVVSQLHYKKSQLQPSRPQYRRTAKERRRESGNKRGTHVSGKLPVVEIALENDELAGLEVLVHVLGHLGQVPERVGVGPVAVRTDDELPLGVELAQLAEEEGEVGLVGGGQRRRGDALQLLVVRGRLVERLRVGEEAQGLGKVGGQDVRDEPGNGLGVEDDVGGEAGGQQVAGEDEVDVELEAGVVEDDVDPAFGLALGLGLLEGVKGAGEVVDQDVLLGGLAGLGALELLDVLVGQGGEEGQVGGVAPEADLAHFGEEEPLSVFVVGDLLVGPEVLDEFFVSRGEFEDGWPGRAESVDLLAVKDVVVLPVCRLAEEGTQAPNSNR